MRKYIKPELEVISFEVKADVMVNPTTAPTPEVGATVLSVGNSYISEFENQAWTSVDGTNWNWAQ